MKAIAAGGITYIEPLSGSREWYWGSDYASGDLCGTVRFGRRDSLQSGKIRSL